MSTLYEAAQELKASLERYGDGTAVAYEKTLLELGANPRTVDRLMEHPNPAAISDYAFACLAVHTASILRDGPYPGCSVDAKADK